MNVRVSVSVSEADLAWLRNLAEERLGAGDMPDAGLVMVAIRRGLLDLRREVALQEGAADDRAASRDMRNDGRRARKGGVK